MNLRSFAVICAALIALGSCGGGSPQEPTSLRTAPSGPYGAVSAQVAVEQLLAFGESTFGDIFPGPNPTYTLGAFRYRYYRETGVYLGVAVGATPGDGLVESGVYVMGGPFGNAPGYKGLLASFITPVVPPPDAAPGIPTYMQFLPAAPKGSGRACSNRLAWGASSARITAITAQADALLSQPFPAWNNDQYLAWKNSGLLIGESMMAARKAWLYPLVLAECAQWQGKYLSAIDMVLRQLATQRTWISPGQDSTLKAYNNGEWFMDLVSASMAHELAQALYLLGSKVTPETRQIVTSALETRVFAPVRQTLINDKDGWWLHTVINWNAVILCDVVGAALTVITSKSDRAVFAAMGETYIRNFVSEFPESGYGIEGPAYWSGGVRHFSVLRHRLFEASAGRVDLLRAAKPQAFSVYSARIEMTPQGAIAPFGDSWRGTRIDPQTRAYVSAAYGTFGAWPGNVAVLVNPNNLTDMPLVDASLLLTESVPWAQGYATPDFGYPGLHSYFADVGVLVTRAPPEDPNPLAATIKSAGNGNHGHDDVGSYSIAIHGGTLAGDVGIGNYTSRTFSNQRRTIKWINSYGHPVPVVGGRLQVDATTATNTVLSTNFTDGRDDISINMAPAYALPAGWSLVRRLANDRVARSISVVDEFSGFSSAQEFEVPITTFESWAQSVPGRIDFSNSGGGHAFTALIEASAAYSVVGETITDDGLTFQRIAIRLNAPATNGWVRVTYTR